MATPTSSNGLNTSGSSAVKVQIGRDANVESLGQKPVAPNADINAMAEQYQPAPIAVKQVDHIALEGSNKGDHRAKAAPAVLPKQPNPREQMGQFPLSGRTPATSAPITTDDLEGIGG